MKNNNLSNQRGFTLVELLIVISLIVIATGVTGDIILTLVRSYNKTQITNEIEQNGNFIISKIEKELISSLRVTEPAAVSGAVKQIKLLREINDNNVEVTYTIISEGGVGKIKRTEGAGAPLSLTNDNPISGVDLSFADSYFILSNKNPDVVQVHLVFRQIGTPSKSFVGNVTLDTSVVVRGTY